MRIGCGSAASAARHARRPSRKRVEEAARPAPAKKLSFKDQRDLDRLPGEVERIEGEIAAAEAALADPDLFMKDNKRFAALSAKIDQLREERDAAEMRWLEVAEMAEQLGR